MTRRIIVRADDIGYSEVYNMGSFESIDNGIVTAADVMLDGEGAEHALEELNKRPWISFGWHAHFWGYPLIGPDKGSTLIDKDTGMFRQDLIVAMDVDYDQIAAELEAQMQLCIRIMGKTPDSGPSVYPGSPYPFERALEAIIKKYRIPTNFYRKHPAAPPDVLPEPLKGKPLPLVMREKFAPGDESWGEHVIYRTLGGLSSVMEDSIKKFNEEYDPVKYYTQDIMGRSALPEGAALMTVWHPGNIDTTVYFKGDYFVPIHNNFLLCRLIDIKALCSQEIKDWVRENKIELINYRDALYGTNDYQRHLRDIGSDLCVL